MSEVIAFTPRSAIDAERNLADFITVCRDELKVFPGISWFDDSWDITEYLGQTGRGKARSRVLFESLSGDLQPAALMSGRFKDFAKAYIKYTFGLNPTKILANRLAALRAFEAALLNNGSERSITDADAATFNLAASITGQRLTGSAYRVGIELERLAEFICGKRMVRMTFKWRNPIRRDQDKNRVGPKADQDREEKLPSQAALDALPMCFLMAQEPQDVIITSVTALLLCAPSRISEVFSLPVECEVEREYKGKMRYGLRWWPAKGAEPMVKWIPSSMADITKDAIRRLRDATASARTISAWYVNNPRAMYLSERLAYLRQETMWTLDDLSDVVGLPRRQIPAWCRQNAVDLHPLPDKQKVLGVYFMDVEKAVLSLLPENFPIICPRTELTYDNALLVVRRNELHPRKGTYDNLIDPINTGTINTGLGSRAEFGFSSVFSRFGFAEPDGKPIIVTSHQFRHWLNTLAQRGGLSQFDIAKWSARVNEKQNRDYNHMTGTELIAMVRSLEEDDQRLHGMPAEFIVKAPVSRKEFLELEFPTAHVTAIGFCIHDYVMSPCEMHGDCINCEEHACVKGDKMKTTRIKENLVDAERQLAKAEKAKADGNYGAERWHEHHLLTVARLKNLIDILDDPTVPVGSIIKLANPMAVSQTRLAIEDRRNTQKENTDRSTSVVLNEIRLLMG